MRTVTISGRRFLIRPASIEEIIELRYELLIRPTTYPHRSFAGDDLPTTIHVAAFSETDIVGCLSLMVSEWEGCRAFQLRGMAVVPELRSLGLGGHMLQYAHEATERVHPGCVVWCNAQVPAMRFYQRHGYRIASDEFMVEGVCPHVKMVLVSAAGGGD